MPRGTGARATRRYTRWGAQLFRARPPRAGRQAQGPGAASERPNGIHRRRTAEQFTAQGFGFEMRVVVVDPEASQLGIYERFATGLASPSALPRFTLPSYHIDALAQMPKTLAAVVKLAKVVRFVDRQGRELYSSRASVVSPVKALEDLRRQPLPDAERRRITQQWASLVQRLDRDGVPAMVREGVRSEQTRFAALLEQGRAAPSGWSQEGLDR